MLDAIWLVLGSFFTLWFGVITFFGHKILITSRQTNEFVTIYHPQHNNTINDFIKKHNEQVEGFHKRLTDIEKTLQENKSEILRACHFINRD